MHVPTSQEEPQCQPKEINVNRSQETKDIRSVPLLLDTRHIINPKLTSNSTPVDHTKVLQDVSLDSVVKKNKSVDRE